MAHDAARPKIKFSGTAMPAAMNVSFIADNTIGSLMFSTYVEIPFCNAVANTAASGNTTNTPRNASATAINAQRTSRGSVVARSAIRWVRRSLFRCWALSPFGDEAAKLFRPSARMGSESGVWRGGVVTKHASVYPIAGAG